MTAYAVVNSKKHAHVKGQRSNHHIFEFQPNPAWAKKRPNRYTSFLLEIITRDPSIYTISHPKFIVTCIRRKNTSVYKGLLAFQNRIEKIENLECCKNLTFLTLSSNRIRKLENLTCLKKHFFLIISEHE